MRSNLRFEAGRRASKSGGKNTPLVLNEEGSDSTPRPFCIGRVVLKQGGLVSTGRREVENHGEERAEVRVQERGFEI